MNNTQLLGRLVRNADFNKFDNNSVARFTLAVDKGLSKEKKEEMEMQGKPTADFISCQAWGKTAEFINNYTEKGSRIAVVGRIQTGSYEKDGQMVYTTDVLVQNVEVIDWKNSNFQNGNIQNGYNKGYAIDATVANNATVEEQLDYPNDFDPTEDNRIPF